MPLKKRDTWQARRLPKKYEPAGATGLWKCTVADCGSDATRAVYQHGHKDKAESGDTNPEAMITWEVPAYVDSAGNLCKWKCPLCNEDVAPVIVKCSACWTIDKK